MQTADVGESGELVGSVFASYASNPLVLGTDASTMTMKVVGQRTMISLGTVYAFAERYDAITRVLCAPDAFPKIVSPEARRRAARRWFRRRIVGKTLSVLRLMKSAFTFEDGASYLVWKIERHSGVRFELTPWQKRHPILASGTLFWRIYRAGGFR